MPKFQNINEAFWYIRENPLEFLPEKSLALFNAFWMGYEWRYDTVIKETEPFFSHIGFNEFMCKKYRVPSNHNPYGVAEFYSKNQSDAFDLWFACLEEFLSESDKVSEVETDDFNSGKEDKTYGPAKKVKPRNECDFFEFLKVIFKRSVMYISRTSFTLVVSLIEGWLKAIEDFDFEESEQEKTFKNFQRYIEDKPFWIRASEENASLPPTPSWNKIIWFRTAHIAMEEKALETFAEYFDEFAFQGKGFVEYVEFHWKNHLEHQKDCHIIKRWKNSN